MLVTGPHQALYNLLYKILKEQYGETFIESSKCLGNESKSKKRLKSKSVTLVDFGVKIKVSVQQVKESSKIELRASFLFGEYKVNEKTTTEYLQHLYGMNSISSTSDRQNDKISIIIDINEAVSHFDSTQEFAMSLSQIRVQAVGSPILNALRAMDEKKMIENGVATSSNSNFIYKLGTHGKCGTFHCICTNEK